MTHSDVDETWLVIKVRLPAKSGVKEEEGSCTLLRPKTWLAKRLNPQTNMIWLEFGETKTKGWYPVVTIKKHRLANPSNGQLILSTINRVVGGIRELKIEGEPETIKGTGSHKIWSEDRNNWIALGDLRYGEQVLVRENVKAKVEWHRLLPGKFRVFNIEVEGIHCYLVGPYRLLVHNNNGCFDDWDEVVEAGSYYLGKPKTKTAVTGRLEKGSLRSAIQVDKCNQGQGLGGSMYKRMFEKLGGSKKIKGIAGDWSAGSDLTTNIDRFNKLIKEGKSVKEAARGTWTGRMAEKLGYTGVKVIRKIKGPDGQYTKVNVIFTKPKG